MSLKDLWEHSQVEVSAGKDSHEHRRAGQRLEYQSEREQRDGHLANTGYNVRNR